MVMYGGVWFCIVYMGVYGVVQGYMGVYGDV